MKAVILAAGIASRLRPLTNNTPKCLLKVGEKNILQLTIENLLANNITNLVMVTGYLEQQIKDFIAITFPQLNVTYIYNEVYDSTNNIYSLWLAKNELLGDEMLLMDSDIIFDSKIIAALLNSGYENCLALKRHNVGEEEIKVKADNNGRVLEISKIVPPSLTIGESIGIEKFCKKSLYKLFEIIDRKVVQEKMVNIFYEVAFEEMTKEGENIFIVDTTEYICMEIDTATDLQTAAEVIKKLKFTNQ
ncbi:MAG: sugar phosphate nucleotidyltransferase [Bacteroidales bacterium]